MHNKNFLANLNEALDIVKDTCLDFASAIEADLQVKRPQMLAVADADSGTPEYVMDLALLHAARVAVVPTHSPFSPLLNNGHRFLLGADGLYLEVRRPWLHFIHRLSEQTAVAMPYGRIEQKTELAFGRLSNALDHIRAFARQARSISTEAATLIVWDAQKKELRELELITSATAASVKYDIPQLADHESIAIDLHSHASMSAFFSGTDNQDDAGSVKISGVIGNLDTDTPTAAFRLCALGLYLPIAVPTQAIFPEE